MPADNPGMLAKASSRGCDALILDLEDAVAPANKVAARAAAIEYAAAASSDSPAVWVRVNDGDLGLDDVRAVAGAPGVAGIWFPKAEPGPWLEEALALAGSTRVGLLIESAAGVARLAQFPTLPEDTLVQPGEMDLAASLGIASREDQLLVFRSMIVAECAARGLPAPLAPVAPGWGDLPEYRAQSQRLKEWGFVGRACIHPAQVAEANEVWSVTHDELMRARAIVDEFEAHEAQGVGAFRGADGAMVDRATVRWARSVVARGI